MTPNQEKWAKARDRLAGAVASLGYPEELAGLLAGQLKSPGAINPTARPQGQPHKKPHSSAGICIGHSMEPISGIWPVIKGRTIAMARKSAA